MTTEPASLGTFGAANDEEIAEFEKPPIPFTLVAYERIVEYLDDEPVDAELVDEDNDPIVSEDDLDRPLQLPSTDVERKTGPIVRHEPREFTFHVYPEVEFGPLFRSLSHADADGTIPVPIAIQFLANAIVPEDRKEFDRVIVEYRVKASMIQELAQALAERYGMNRPTPPRSVRRNGQRHHGRTTEAVRLGPDFN
jgi:hypothetical protein